MDGPGRTEPPLPTHTGGTAHLQTQHAQPLEHAHPLEHATQLEHASQHHEVQGSAMQVEVTSEEAAGGSDARPLSALDHVLLLRAQFDRVSKQCGACLVEHDSGLFHECGVVAVELERRAFKQGLQAIRESTQRWATLGEAPSSIPLVDRSVLRVRRVLKQCFNMAYEQVESARETHSADGKLSTSQDVLGAMSHLTAQPLPTHSLSAEALPHEGSEGGMNTAPMPDPIASASLSVPAGTTSGVMGDDTHGALRLRHMLIHLRSIAAECGLQFDSESDLMNVNWYMWSRSFVLDVEMCRPTGEVHAVKVTRTGEKDATPHPMILDLLRREDFLGVREWLERNSNLTDVSARNADIPVHEALSTIVADVATIHKCEREQQQADGSSSEREILTHCLLQGHGVPGVVEDVCTTACISFYCNAADRLREAAEEGDGVAAPLLKRANVAIVSAEDSRDKQRLPIAPQVSTENGTLEFNMQDPFDQVGATSSEMSGGLSPAASVSLTLHLKPPIAATPSTLHALKSIGWGMGSGQSRDANTLRGEHARSWRTASQVGAASEFKPVSSLPPSFGGVTDLRSLLSGAHCRRETNGDNESACFVNVYGDCFKILHNEATATRGLLLHRVPFCHPSQLLPIFRVLRQQLTFNELYRSVLQQHDGDRSRGDCAENDFHVLLEVSVNAPSSISVTLPDPLAMMLATMHVSIGLNGEVSATIVNPHGVPSKLCSSERISEMLRKTLHIPLVVRKVLHAAQEVLLDSDRDT